MGRERNSTREDYPSMNQKAFGRCDSFERPPKRLAIEMFSMSDKCPKVLSPRSLISCRVIAFIIRDHVRCWTPVPHDDGQMKGEEPRTRRTSSRLLLQRWISININSRSFFRLSPPFNQEAGARRKRAHRTWLKQIYDVNPGFWFIVTVLSLNEKFFSPR